MNKKTLEKEFGVSRYIIVYKFVLGFIEVILGIGFGIWGRIIFTSYQNFRARELLEDPHDLLVNSLEKVVPYLFEHRLYVVSVLLLIGIIKMAGAIGLYFKKHWGLDILVALTVFLLPFDIYGLIIHFTLGRVVYLTINILIVLYLVNFKPKSYVLSLKDSFIRKNK